MGRRMTRVRLTMAWHVGYNKIRIIFETPGISMMHHNQAFSASRSSANPAAVVIVLQNRFSQTAEVFPILPLQRVGAEIKTSSEWNAV